MWDFLRRHRGKIAAGTALIAGGAFATKKAMDFVGKQNNCAENFDESPELRSNILKQRKRFIFEAHQESCDKFILEAIAEIRKFLLKKFNCEELVRRLKEETFETNDEKIAIWRELQAQSFARILVTAHCYSLIVVVLKLQKSILCRDLCSNLDETKPQSQWFDFFSSFFVASENKTKLADQSMLIKSDPDVQQLFSGCINYFLSDGLYKFCDKIVSVAARLTAEIKLTQRLDAKEIKHFLDKVVAEVDVFGRFKNFSSFVVPDSRPVISSLAERSVHLQKLLTELVNALESDEARELLLAFTKMYLEVSGNEFEAQLNNSSLPMAKLIPIATNVFGQLTLTGDSSTFRRTLYSPELFHFVNKIFMQ